MQQPQTEQQRRLAGDQEARIDWLRLLPAEWRDAVDAPLYFRRYREYEILAERTIGYDEDARPCFITHQFALTRLLSDDDEEFYESVSLAEEMTAWRLHDGRWLVLRNTQPDPGSKNGDFYAIHPDAPR
ncbi:hypothetical protein [Azonexus sp.]|uniref:hypothetical protein n=1 Tax=Azonexus sp. TaxID=1872668 RepID=UPI0035B32BDC